VGAPNLWPAWGIIRLPVQLSQQHPRLTDGRSPTPASIPRLVWNGEVPHQKWMNFYTKVLSKFAATAGMKLTLRVEVAPAEGVSPQKVDETKVALRELA
jgi:hypothetical protein